MRTWVGASTVIALDAIGEVALLRDLLGRVTLTSEVAAEVFQGRESEALTQARGTWVEIYPVSGNRSRWESLGLGRGEASLFLTPGTDRVVLDEVPARVVAESEGRSYAGLLGLLLSGVDAGIVAPDRARQILRRLVQSGFRLAIDLYDEAMEQLGRDR
jgi:predicted nucleic acid-binding protein